MKKLNPRTMRRMLKQMGMTEIKDVEEVLIRCVEKELVIPQPQHVSVMDVGGQKMFQILGQATERLIEGEKPIEIPVEDVQLVAEQAGVSPEEAEEALMNSDGDLAKAILALKAK